MNASEAKRLKVLEEENSRLKRLLAEKELEIQALTDIIKKFLSQEELKMLIRPAHTQFNVPISVLGRRFALPRASFYQNPA